MDFDPEALLAAAEERKRLGIAKVEDRYQRDIRAIERVRSLVHLGTPANGHSHPPDTPGSAKEATPDRHYLKEPWPGIALAVRRAIAAQATLEFTLDSVLNWLQPRFPDVRLERVDISRELWRVKEKGGIEVAVEGAGKRPAIYRKRTNEVKEI